MRHVPLIALVSAFLLSGCKVSRPTRIEQKVVVAAEHEITVGNRSQKNPLATNAATIAAGKEAFGHYCVACHGLDGAASGVPFADQMSPPIPALSSPQVQSYTDGQLKWVIDYGLSPSGMPASKGTLSDEEMWSIVVFLRHLPAPGSVGEPEMYSH